MAGQKLVSCRSLASPGMYLGEEGEVGEEKEEQLKVEREEMYEE